MGKCIGCGRPCVTDGQEVWCPPCAIRKINELESRINEFIHDENNPPLAGQFITDAEIGAAVRVATKTPENGTVTQWIDAILAELNIFRCGDCTSDPSLRGDKTCVCHGRGWVRKPKPKEAAGGDGS